MADKIFKLTFWVSLIAILLSLLVQTHGLTNRQVLAFFSGLAILSAAVWAQQMQEIKHEPTPVPANYLQLTIPYIKWSWWGIVLALLSLTLMGMVVVDIVAPNLLPSNLQSILS